MNNTTDIRSEIKNLKITKTFFKVSTTICTYKLGTILALDHMNLITKTSDFQINSAVISCLLFDFTFSYNYWQCEHKIERLNKELVLVKKKRRRKYRSYK